MKMLLRSIASHGLTKETHFDQTRLLEWSVGHDMASVAANVQHPLGLLRPVIDALVPSEPGLLAERGHRLN